MRRLVPAALLMLCGCQIHLLDPKVEPLKVDDISLVFHSQNDGQVSFAFTLPKDAGDVVNVWWDVALDDQRFATGVAGAPVLSPTPEGGWRVRVTSPLVLKQLTYREGATYLNVLVRGEVRLKRRGVDERLPFTGEKEVLTTGAPVTRERIQP